MTIGATAVVARAVASTPKPPPGGFSALSVSFLAYAEYTVIPVSVLAVLQFTSEYSSGLIRTTFAAVPQRWTVLAGKAAVVGAAALVIGEVLAFGRFALVQAILSGQHRSVSLAQPGVAGAVLAAGFVLCACALTAIGLAAIIRHTAGAITATLAVIYLIAGLCLSLPSPWKTDIGRFTMAFAASQVTALHPQAGLFSPGGSMLVLVAWPPHAADRGTGADPSRRLMSMSVVQGSLGRGRRRGNRGTVAWARYCATAASQTARTGQPRTRAAASASASSAVAVPKPAGPSAVPATLTVTTWPAPGGPTSTATDVRAAVSRFIRDQRTPSVPVWAKIAAATARRTGSAHGR